MRFLIFICLFFVMGCNSSVTKKSSDKVATVVSENSQTVAVEVSIKAMTCTGCEQTIQSGISSLKGVKQVKADFKNGKAFVEFMPDVADTVQMKEKIVASGYAVAAIKSIPLDSLRSKL